MGWCSDSKEEADKASEEKITVCKTCEAAKAKESKRGNVEFVKDDDSVTDEDVEKAKAAWDEAKEARHKDGSKPQTVKALEGLEASDKKTTVVVMNDSSPNAADGNAAGPSNREASQNGTGSDATIWFNPNDSDDYDDGTERKPSVSLAHEAQHAFEYTQGTSPDTREGREKSATKAENEHRHTQDMKQRDKYGDWEVEQYEPPAEDGD